MVDSPKMRPEVSLGMPEFAKFGIIKFVVGLLITIFTIGYKLLPIRVAKSSEVLKTSDWMGIVTGIQSI